MAPGQRGMATFQYFNSVRHLSAYTVLTGRQTPKRLRAIPYRYSQRRTL